MKSIFWEVFGNNSNTESKKSFSPLATSRMKKIEEISLLGVEFVSLPSPSNEEAENKENESESDWHFSNYGQELYNAFYNKKYHKVVSLVDIVDLNQKEVSEIFLKSYRKLISKASEKSNYKIALKWSTEMLQKLQFLVTDYDKNRHNRLVEKLNKEGIKHNFSSTENKKSSSKFKIIGDHRWGIINVKRLSFDERPSTQFKEHYFVKDGVISIAKGSSLKYYEHYKSVLQFSQNNGEIKIIGLNQDIYRIYVNFFNPQFAILSSDCVLYSYNLGFDLSSQIDLKDLDVVKNFIQYTSSFDELKRFIRCVAVTPQSENILFTIVDEAYLLDKSGKIIWGVKSPTKEGYTKFSKRIKKEVSSKGVQDALNYLGLTFPFSNEDVKVKYRLLAKLYHPDLHPNDPESKSKFQKLQSSYQYLLGSNPEDYFEKQDQEISVYRDNSSSLEIEIPGEGLFEMGMYYGYLAGCDWIYSAGHSNSSGNIYLGTYSGRIFELNVYGQIQRVYDVGTLPNTVLEHKNFLYILAGGRAYILQDKKVFSFIDIYQDGKIRFCEDGFVLLSKKSFQFYDVTGNKKFEMQSEDPIRKFFKQDNVYIIETRQDRAIISKTDNTSM